MRSYVWFPSLYFRTLPVERCAAGVCDGHELFLVSEQIETDSDKSNHISLCVSPLITGAASFMYQQNTTSQAPIDSVL